MRWNKGYSAAYHVSIVDAESWADTGTVNIVDGDINREADGLLQSADVTTANYSHDGECYIRIYLDAKQGGNYAHVPLFTGLATVPGKKYNGTWQENTLQCFSVLKPADDILLPLGWYAVGNSDGVIRDLLSVTPAPVIIGENAPVIASPIIAEENETRLTMIEKILTAINWRIWIEGNGVIHVEPKPQEPAVVFDPIENDVIEAEIDIEFDWYKCPNVFRAIQEELSAIARDESIDSPLSIVNRGREVWMQDTSCDLAEGESIAEYAQRRLKEEQQVYMKASYNRRFIPDIMPGDLIQMKYPAQGIVGTFKVSTQSIKLGACAVTTEGIEYV